MVCSICGAQISDGQSYCDSCGAQINVQQSQNIQQSQYNPQQQYIQQPQYNPQQQYIQQPKYNPQQQYIQQPQYNQQYQNNFQPQGIQFNNTAVPGLGMGWFYFVIFIQLFLNALSNFAQGISVMFGKHYDGNADLVYDMLPSMKVIDVLMGIACLLLAAGAIYARFRLAKYRKNGPLMYHSVICANIIIPIIYLLCIVAVLNNNFYSITVSDFVPQRFYYNVAGCVALLIVNIIYFGKRKHLFVN